MYTVGSLRGPATACSAAVRPLVLGPQRVVTMVDSALAQLGVRMRYSIQTPAARPCNVGISHHRTAGQVVDTRSNAPRVANGLEKQCYQTLASPVPGLLSFVGQPKKMKAGG